MSSCSQICISDGWIPTPIFESRLLHRQQVNVFIYRKVVEHMPHILIPRSQQVASQGYAHSRTEDTFLGLQQLGWSSLADPSQCCDTKLINKRDLRCPDLVYPTTKEALALLVEPELAYSKHGATHFDSTVRENGENQGIANAYGTRVTAINVFPGSFEVLDTTCSSGGLSEAVQAVNLIQQEGACVSTDIFFRLLQRCIIDKNVAAGQEVYCLIIKNGCESDAFLVSHLIRMFVFFESLLEATRAFSKLPKPTTYAWSAIILAHATLGQNEQAIKLYYQMQESNVQANGHVFVSVLKACSNTAILDQGKHIHWHIIESGLALEAFVGCALIDMYVKCGSLNDAHMVFEKLQQRNVETWNALIAGYSKHGNGQKAFHLLERMHQGGVDPNRVTFLCILKACANQADLEQGRCVHAHIIESGLESGSFVGNTLVDMYAKCLSLDDAHMLFDKLPNRDVVTWNALLAGYTQHGHGQAALLLFEKMEEAGIKPNQVTFLCILNACSSVGSLAQGRHIHARFTARGFELDGFVGNALVDMYAKCGSLEDAHLVFDNLVRRDVVTWSALIVGYLQHGHGQEVLQLFKKMQQEDLKPNEVTFDCLLKACGSIASLDQGKQIHSQIIESSIKLDAFIGSALVDMYAKCGSLEDACTVFDSLPSRDVVTWSVLISGYTQHGHGWEALVFFSQMQKEGMKPDQVAYVCALKACSIISALEQGRYIHALMIKSGFELDEFVGSILIDMYAACGSLEDARAVFDSLAKQDIVTWSALIASYAQHGQGQEALQLFDQMRHEGVEPNPVTFVNVLKFCSRIATLVEGRRIHTHTIESGFYADVFVGNTLIDVYSKCGNLEGARILFCKLPERNVVTWNALITGYVLHAEGEEALELFQQMKLEGVEPDVATFVCILKACASVAALEQGRCIHSHIIKSGFEVDISVGNTLIDMYAKCGRLVDARLVFDALPERDIVTCNVLMSGYARYEHGVEALQLFENMHQEGMHPDPVTFVCIIKVCSSMAAFEQGQQIHADVFECGFETDVFIGNSLIDMYMNCGSPEDAHVVFDRLPERELVTWNVLIAGYSQHGYSQRSLQLFEQMQEDGMVPSWFTYIYVLKACCSVAAFEQGRKIHFQIIESGSEQDACVGSTLIDMYAKCGSLQDAQAVFLRLPAHDVVTWSALIAGYAQHDNGLAALQIFEDMQLAGFKPDDVTFVCLLTACSHVGLVEEGCSHFKLMREKHNIAPSIEHYNSMVDLLGHAGFLDEAEDLLETIPFWTNIVGWTSLLSSCRTSSKVNLGRRCFDLVVAMDPGNAAAYVLMAIIYAHAGMPEDAEKVEGLRKCAKAWKKPGMAFIEIDNKVHHFTVGEKGHPRIADIYAKLKTLSRQMREQGYTPHPDWIVKSKSDEKKEDALCGHCEKLAIAFGLISTPRGTTIRVAKNLRMCADCHVATKIISKIEVQEIVVKDSYRIHHFQDGACSCRDYY